jgi:hypothetical protein
MHAGSFISDDGKRVEIRRVPNPEHIDPIVLDPITQYFDGGLYKLWPGERYYSRSARRIHRDVWESAFGPIPAGCHIHHRDSNSANNALTNLECLPKSDHLSATWKNSRAHLEKQEHFSDHARRRAAEWHKSEAGRLWHSRMAKQTKGWTKRKREERPCLYCGEIMLALVAKGTRLNSRSQKYCGEACKASAYRKRNGAFTKPSGQESHKNWQREDRLCQQCGKIYSAVIRQTGIPQKFCSADCRADSRIGNWRREDRTCDNCGESFSAVIRKTPFPQKYCSPACRNAFNNRKRLEAERTR